MLSYLTDENGRLAVIIEDVRGDRAKGVSFDVGGMCRQHSETLVVKQLSRGTFLVRHAFYSTWVLVSCTAMLAPAGVIGISGEVFEESLIDHGI